MSPDLTAEWEASAQRVPRADDSPAAVLTDVICRLWAGYSDQMRAGHRRAHPRDLVCRAERALARLRGGGGA